MVTLSWFEITAFKTGLRFEIKLKGGSTMSRKVLEPTTLDSIWSIRNPRTETVAVLGADEKSDHFEPNQKVDLFILLKYGFWMQ